MMDLQDYRVQIDKVDDALLLLFKERMHISRKIAVYKKEHGLPALDAGREKEKLAAIGEAAGEGLRHYANNLYLALFEISRAYQESVLNAESAEA
jgi:chorismate mutase/prephenate dehydratase